LTDPLEIVSFLQLKRFNIPNVYLVVPQSLPVDTYKSLWPEIQVERFNDGYFESISSYNKLMLSKEFYERFSIKYVWMLIHQLDAFVFENKLDYFCQMPYDYFGAPWYGGQLIRPRIINPRLLQLVGKRIYVGNGGFSLRKIKSFIDLIIEKESILKSWRGNEDGFYSYYGKSSKWFKSCPVNIASQFSIESAPEFWLSENGGHWPMGCHAFNKIEQVQYSKIINSILPNVVGLSEALNGVPLPMPYKIHQ
jgi:hypothetical protein